MSLDRSRPNLKRNTRRGVGIYQFNEEPGVYYNANGEPVDEDLAKQAGFDIAAGQKARRRRELEADARKDIDAKMMEVDEQIDIQLAEEAGEAPPVPHVKKIGKKWSVFDASGTETAGDMTKKEADALLEEVRQQ